MGLGSFDGMEVALIKIAGSKIASLAPKVVAQKAWWKRW